METTVLIFMGMVASGKSYLAEAIVKETSCAYFSSDVLRKELAGLDGESRQWSPVGAGIYSPEMSRKTYDEMLERARAAVSQKQPLVILDGSYNKTEERARVQEGLVDLCKIRFVYCYCDRDVAYSRMANRGKDALAISDGRPLIYEHQLKTYELPRELNGEELLEVNTDAEIGLLVQEVLAL